VKPNRFLTITIKTTLKNISATPKLVWYGILALALIRGLIYASVVPPWQAPDEPAQFERARAALSAQDWVATSDNPPAWYDQLIRSLFAYDYYDYINGTRQAYEPQASINRYLVLYQEAYADWGGYGSRPAYYAIGWPILLASHSEVTLQLYLVRLNMVLMNVGILVFAYLIPKLIFPEDNFLPLGVPIIILFNPQHTHMLSTVNNGNLAELLAIAALYFLVRVVIQGLNGINIGGALFFSLAAMWAKATGYFLIFVIAGVTLICLWRFRTYWRWFIPLGLALTAVPIFLAPERLLVLAEMAWSHLRYGTLYLDPIVPIDLFRSYWAMPGWMILTLHPLWYRLLLISHGLALVGLLWLGLKKRHLLTSKPYQKRVQALLVLGLAMVTAVGILLTWNALTNVIVYRQGRSIYPAMAAVSLFTVLGWRQLFPARLRNHGLYLIAGLFFLFDFLVLFGHIIPLFYSRY
jgi:hypothetical protein